MRLIRRLIGIAVGALPIALVATLLAWPLWGRFEAATGIESLGHSGPAEWCFAAVYGLCVAVGVSVFARR
ncbi:MAG: hypothetical protein AB7N69_01300 [Immundisolibacter sp.]|uniref:hypothetical protein n=1 Tax=Immundisolibacter sp. TaxID=1934948 RepID=UPI003D0D95D7